MKVVKILVLTFFSFSFLIFSFASSAKSIFDQSPNFKTEKPKPVADKSPNELYAQNCARCHGADGRGETELGRTFDVPNIADARWQSKHSDAKISKKIARGGGGMPAFAKKLTAKETALLVTYLRTLKK